MLCHQTPDRCPQDIRCKKTERIRFLGIGARVSTLIHWNQIENQIESMEGLWSCMEYLCPANLCRGKDRFGASDLRHACPHRNALFTLGRDFVPCSPCQHVVQYVHPSEPNNTTMRVYLTRMFYNYDIDF